MKTKGGLWTGQQEKVPQDSTVPTFSTADRGGALIILPLAPWLASLNEIEPCHCKSEVSKSSTLVEPRCPHVFVRKVLLEQVPPIHLHTAYGGFHITAAVLSHGSRESVEHKAKIFYCLSLDRSLLTCAVSEIQHSLC